MIEGDRKKKVESEQGNKEGEGKKDGKKKRTKK